jgi:hypothetical protein
MPYLRHLLVLALGFFSLAAPALAGLWTPIGPDGGAYIRRLLVDPVTPTGIKRNLPGAFRAKSE